ncbi:MAG: hypothetical protein EOO16_24295 [Chitinophagaceae bacterium]|nr:MAG: hypothetical protein EOO16_24295 [Chitinophagaceae bacterium]
MFWKLFGRRIKSPVGLFNGPFFDVRTAYVLRFDRLPSVTGVGEIDGGKAYAHLRATLGHRVRKTWQHSYFDRAEESVRFNVTILELDNRSMLEIGPTWVEVLHDGDFHWANALVTELAAFRDQPKETSIGFARSRSMN